MGVTPAHLRTWILILGGSLVAAVAFFLMYGRWQVRRLGRDLPGKLSTLIQQSTEGFTHSESRGGHTLYTLHASKAVQFKKDGHAELHDVSITLYDAKGAPANRIYGNSFDWDPVHGIARALGEVQIDFQGSSAAPGLGSNAASSQQARKFTADDGESKTTVHVKTSGLVFNKETGLASTTEKIEFRLAQAAGSATGASFDSQSGVVILAADVAFTSSVSGNPLQVRAHHAQFDRDSRQLYLLQDVTDYADSHGSSGQATVWFRADGSAYQMLAEGNVVLAGNGGQQIHTRKVHIDLGPRSEPRQALVNGGLLYTANQAGRLLHGSASSATLLFGSQTTIRHAQLRDAVSLVAEEKYLPHAAGAGSGKQSAPQSTSRQLQASKVDIDFSTGADQATVADHILAVGQARLNVHEIYAKTPPQDTTVQGDQLFATLTDGEVLSSLRGTGHTSLVVASPSGARQSSTGENLLLTFAAPAGSPAPVGSSGKTGGVKASNAAQQASAQLQLAVQSGSVTLVQEAGAKADEEGPGRNSAGVSTATADRAAYDAATQIVQLAGNPRIKDTNGELSAASIEVDRATGNANATGGVKATYRQGGRQSFSFTGTGPIHVIADHAHLDHEKDLTTFYGTAREQARLWQGSDSIAAPVLELSRARETLSAHAEDGKAAGVNAVLTSSPSPSKGAMPAKTAGTSVVRLQSKTLLYAEGGRKAVFGGGVTAQAPSGLMRSNFMDIYFSAAAGVKAEGPQASQQGSQVSRIVARGAVVLEQPGRKGTGEELNYTAQDGKFVLTGSSAAAPRLVDEVRGTITGAALIFNDRDDSVTVDGGPSKAVTQTHVTR